MTEPRATPALGPPILDSNRPATNATREGTAFRLAPPNHKPQEACHLARGLDRRLAELRELAVDAPRYDRVYAPSYEPIALNLAQGFVSIFWLT